MNDLQKEFKKFVKEEFDCDVVEVSQKDADTFEKIFDTDFLQGQKLEIKKGSSKEEV